MQHDDIIVTHEGREWLVKDGRLVSFTTVVIELPKTPEEYNQRMAEGIPTLRDAIIKHIADNDPYCKI